MLPNQNDRFRDEYIGTVIAAASGTVVQLLYIAICLLVLPHNRRISWWTRRRRIWFSLFVLFTIAATSLACVIFRRSDDDAYRYLAGLKGTSILSIGSLQVAEFVFAALSAFKEVTWARVLFGMASVLQLVYLGLGVWQLVLANRQFVWAGTICFHIYYTVLGFYSGSVMWRSGRKLSGDSKWMRVCSWAAVSFLSCLASSALIFIEVAELEEIPLARELGQMGQFWGQWGIIMVSVLEGSFWRACLRSVPAARRDSSTETAGLTLEAVSE